MASKISVVLGDITQIKVDAVVNAANCTLRGGGGVDGAIHRACGPELLSACRPLNGCETGGAKSTPAFGAMAQIGVKYIIHAVGPVWQGGQHGEAALLGAAYRHSLEIARLSGAKSVAFPAISCGVYGYPINQAAKIAVETVKAYLGEYPNAFAEVVFVAFGDNILNQFKQYLP